MVNSVLLFFEAALLIALLSLSTVTYSQTTGPSVYWDKSIDVELSERHMFKESDWAALQKKIQAQSVISLQREGCGRAKNMLAILEDGTKVCCRYREHQLKELRGEIYTYFFNRLLNLWSAPPSMLIHVDFSSDQWRQVAREAQEMGWKDHSNIVITFFVEDISDVFIPPLLKDNTLNLTLENVQKLAYTHKQKLQLAQWSDLIVHDFIIGHTDRLFNTLFNLQWNPRMMEISVHNLKQTSKGQLVLLDNESGFWMGYSLQEWDPMKYQFQVHFLKRLCLFRESTAERIRQLASLSENPLSADMYLEQYINSHDHFAFSQLPKLTLAFRKEYISRLSTVLHHIQSCANHLF